MATLTPRQAAKLANDIYLVQKDKASIELFFDTNGTILSQENTSVMKAEVGFRLINARDSFGTCVKGAGDFKNDAFLIFRGSTLANKCADWVSNARIGLEIGATDVPVHIGFNHIFKSMLKEIETFILNLPETTQVVHCVGHSLGGAVATLAADWIKKNKNVTTKIYTFGAPRPATHLFAKKFTDKLDKKNIYRVYHESDPVPMIPVFPFCHAPFGSMGYMIQTSNIIWPFDHMMGKYMASVRKHSWLSLSPVGDYEPTEAELKQWLESKLQVNPQAVSTWKWLNSAICFVLRKVMSALFIAKLQACFIGAVTIADAIASVLAQGFGGGGPKSGASPAGSNGYLVVRLMRKILQVLGWKSDIEEEQLTRSFMSIALQRLIQKSNVEATRAVMSLTA